MYNYFYILLFGLV